jgi:hypothetical protein
MNLEEQQSGNRSEDAKAGRITHLTVEWWCRNVEVNEVKDDGDKDSCARKRVNLRDVPS